jgi:elongation factor P--(R)-beta-lysine ligase
MAALRARAALLARCREFFAERGVLEVETPLLGRHGVTDLQLSSMAVPAPLPGAGTHYLQTSPEYAMKRLIASGAPDLYQICKAFRGEERSRRHNPEFTIVEWYRRDCDADRLMDEVEALLGTLLGVAALGRPSRRSYRELLRSLTGLDPLTAPLAELADYARARLGPLPELADRDALLDLIVGAILSAELGRDGLLFIYDYPASQAALARLSPRDSSVARRFEAYLGGLELCNGFEELADAGEQRARFAADNALREARGREAMASDERLLAALAAGLPECSGVALGLDRVLMLALGAQDIAEVIAFPLEIA